jgi:hypothetical protein
MIRAAIRILRALHTALGRWIGETEQPAEVVKGKANSGPYLPSSRGTPDGDKPRVRTRKGGRTGGDQHTTDPPPASERRRTSWFDCDRDTLHAALPRDPEAEEAEAWYRAHFRINGQRLP